MKKQQRKKMENKPLELVGLKINNLQNIELVNVDFRGKKLVEVTGDNGASKTTLIDGIFIAMQGPKYISRGYPAWRLIKAEEDRARLKVIIGNSERTIEVKRSITKKDLGNGKFGSGGALSITDTAGNNLDQKFLDNLISEFTIDPVGFASKPPKDQIDILKELGGIDTTALDEEKDKAYQERTILNRKRAELKVAIKITPDKYDPVDAAEIGTLIQETMKANEAIRRERQEREDYGSKTAQKEKEIVMRQEEIKQLQITVNNLKNEVENRKKTAAEKPKLKAEADMEALNLALNTATETNKKAAAWAKWELDSKEYDKVAALIDIQEEILDTYPEKKKQLIKESKLPFDNLDFDEEIGLIIGGIPFSQKSAAEQIQISTRIGMELKPDFKVICIKDGSLLDEKTFAVIKEMAEKYKYQVLIERVGEKEGENQIVMRAGKLISEFEKEATIKEKTAALENSL